MEKSRTLTLAFIILFMVAYAKGASENDRIYLVVSDQNDSIKYVEIVEDSSGKLSKRG